MNPRFSMTQLQAAPASVDPADACTNWAWLRTVLAPLGLTVLVVEWPLGPCPGPMVGLEISQKLLASELGYFDAIKVGKLTRFFFNVAVARLVEALQTVESELRVRDLLAGAKIGHADAEAGVWRTYVPSTGAHS
jgi:hypothetical protein